MILSAYYRQNNYHPLYALRSLFALFIQIPFFIAAYQLLSELPALKETSFLFLKDLGSPDKLVTIGSISLNILPVIMTVINIAASAVYTKGLELKEKLTLYLTAFLFLILLYNSPSGLVLYWTLNNIFSLFKNSEPYKYSLELIENNQDVMEYLGEEYKLPIIISGSMSMNGNGMGQASLSYKIKGKNGISRVYIDAEKENGIWKYNKVIFYKEKGKADSIDLLLNKE